MQPAQSLLDQRLRALADPTRRGILRLIKSRDTMAGEIATQFDMTRPAVSRHLRVLREARLVRIKEVGTARLYRADAEAWRDMRGWFDRFWDDGLPRLKTLAEAEAKDRHT